MNSSRRFTLSTFYCFLSGTFLTFYLNYISVLLADDFFDFYGFEQTVNENEWLECFSRANLSGGSTMLIFILLTYYTTISQVIDGTIAGILYPRSSESREVKSLDGIWNFRLSLPSDGLGQRENGLQEELKKTGPTIPMPVPASYNDITVNKSIRDYVGVVWYDRKFFVPKSWGENQKVWLRFGSVCYFANVWLNGKPIVSHEIGHLPFKVDVTSSLNYGQENLITVSVDNTLLKTTIPQGWLSKITINNKTSFHQSYTFDFFNYAGIDRPVLLYTTPELYIDDITISTDISDENGIIYFRVDYKAPDYYDTGNADCLVTLYDKEGSKIQEVENCTGKFTVENAKLWWPYLMHSEPGYLYELKVVLYNEGDSTEDVYRLPVGIRRVTWTDTQVFINNKPIYIRGVGKHEDFFIKGKGLDLSLIVKDFDLLKWLGVNTFRTSHYPYSEEIMDLADSLGFMVIDECPSVDTDIYSPTLLQKHKRSLTELFQRDKNRPSVIMWSVSNEPRTQLQTADTYFKNVVDHIKLLDGTRPVTIALSRRVTEDKVGKHLDVVCFNRYNSWYSDTGMTEVIYENVVQEAESWFQKYKKPIIMSEYGADALAGMHYFPERVWSEDYQLVVMEEHFKAFDYLRSRGFFIGEMIWNFADFQTAQTTGRAGGNKKGMFTRQREPKASAFLLRKRYQELAHELDGAPLPKDLDRYTSSVNTSFSE